MSGASPAVGDNGSSVWWVAGLHPPQEGQERGGVLRHSVVRPRRELELPHFPLLARAILGAGQDGQIASLVSWPVINYSPFTNCNIPLLHQYFPKPWVICHAISITYSASILI